MTIYFTCKVCCDFCGVKLESYDQKHVPGMQIALPSKHGAIYGYDTCPQCFAELGEIIKTFKQLKSISTIEDERSIKEQLDTWPSA